MIRFPLIVDEIARCPGEIRAGGTDLQARRRAGVSSGDVVDLRDLPDLDQIERVEPEPLEGEEAPATGATLEIGALVRLSALLASAQAADWPLVASSVAAIPATIRPLATVGGNLLQRVRCPYYRSPEFTCLKKGGGVCFARIGDHHDHACVDLGPCLAPHPSTLGVALVALDAEAEIHGSSRILVEQLLDSGGDPLRENRLEPGQALTGIVLPPPWPNQGSGWMRTAPQAAGVWPSVEVAVRVQVEEGVLIRSRVVAGAVAIRPLRLSAVEQALEGAPVAEAVERASALVLDGVVSPPGSSWKRPVLQAAVEVALARALAEVSS